MRCFPDESGQAVPQHDKIRVNLCNPWLLAACSNSPFLTYFCTLKKSLERT